MFSPTKIALLLSGLFSLVAPTPLANRNLIVDPQFEQATGLGGSAVSTGATPNKNVAAMYYFMGGLGGTMSGAQFSVSDVPNPIPKGMYAPMLQGLKLTQSVASTGTVGASNAPGVWQYVEDFRTLANQSGTYSVWLWTASGTITIPNIVLRQVPGTGGSPSASVLIDKAVNWVVGTTPKRFSVRIDLPSVQGLTGGTNQDNSLQIGVWFPSGQTFTVLTTQWQLEASDPNSSSDINGAGGAPTAFEYRGIPGERVRTARYFQIIGGSGLAYDFMFQGTVAAAGNSIGGAVKLDPMRANPATSIVNGANWNGWSSVNTVTFSAGKNGTGYMNFNVTAAGGFALGTKDATTYLVADARL